MPYMNKTDPNISLTSALEISGLNKSDLARKLGVSRQAVNDWRAKDGMLPPLHAYRFNELFNTEKTA